MLAAIHRVLRPGGHAWLRFNLHRARNASHAYRKVFFPWPHLLFEEDVYAAYCREVLGEERPGRFSWVNRMTIAHYLDAVAALGFDVRAMELKRTPLDVAFYRRFEDKLGRYPVLDLETNFMHLTLHKRRRGKGTVPRAGYLERQLEFDREAAG
jgi:hypothetical protein